METLGNYESIFRIVHKHSTITVVNLIDLDIIAIKKTVTNQDFVSENETKFMEKCAFPSIVSVYFESEESIFMEFCPYMDFDTIIACKLLPITQDQLFIYFYQIARAIEHLHKKKLTHRDIKPGNIFLDANKIAKLGDFGFCRAIEGNEDLSIKLTEGFAAPEITSGHYTNKVDIFSFGKTMRSISDSLGVTSKDLMNLIAECTEENPDKRPSIEKVIESIKSIGVECCDSCYIKEKIAEFDDCVANFNEEEDGGCCSKSDLEGIQDESIFAAFVLAKVNEDEDQFKDELQKCNGIYFVEEDNIIVVEDNVSIMQ